MNNNGNEIKIFSGNANCELAKNIATSLNLPLGKAEIKTFSDGENSVSLYESVRGADCFIVQSTCPPVNNNLMELLVMIDAMKRASAAKITAVMPYFGYARQDRKSHARSSISAKLVADLITVAGADRVLTMDLHSPQIQGFFNIPVDNLLGMPILASFVKKKIAAHKENYIVVAPDLGSVIQARNFANQIGIQFAIIDKRRQKANISEVINIIGDVEGKKVILVDDMTDTSGTLCNAAEAVIKRGGAIEVMACVTHSVLSGQATQKIENSYIKKIYTLDTIPFDANKLTKKFQVLSVAPFFADVINKIHMDLPFSDVFI